MEDDDEFGDLYTDVLRPLTASVQSQPGKIDAHATSQSRPIDPSVNSDDEEILYGASDLKNPVSNSGIGLKLNASIQEKTLPQTGERGGFDLNLYSNKETSRIAGANRLEIEAMGLGKGEGSGGVNFMEEDDDLNIVLEERENKDDDLVEKDVNFIDKQENAYSPAERNETTVNFTGPGPVGDSEQMIPGLSGKLENHGGSNLEDEWESDESEDDLQIVLNDNNHGPMGMERMPGGDDEDDEDGEPLVIVADNGDVGHHHHHQQMMMEEQEYAGEEGGPGADGERKELGDAAKASGIGGAAAPAAVQPKIGYSNHVYHHPFHSQFKYVRPGAAPIPGAAPVTPGGIQGQVRPPVTMGAVAGRGRGDWRPAGMKGAAPMQKGFPGYGMPAWGANAAGRGYGSGLDFTLPSHKLMTYESAGWLNYIKITSFVFPESYGFLGLRSCLLVVNGAWRQGLLEPWRMAHGAGRAFLKDGANPPRPKKAWVNQGAPHARLGNSPKGAQARAMAAPLGRRAPWAANGARGARLSAPSTTYITEHRVI
ncbi:UNVERIFIED_CONTAM: FIP1[V]-like protein [Sesamum latifolium]|uniref:FIP1[V]-like protein n=1 Tax=Sesamum latifolium TaxID=2727402 RepID=A0AAW2VH41_9LAMI